MDVDRARVALALAAAIELAYGRGGLLGPTHVALADKFPIRLCGLPADQLDTRDGSPSYRTPNARIHLGQHLKVELVGDTETDEIRLIRWHVAPAYPNQREAPLVAFEPVTLRVAVLRGVRLSADEDDHDFAYAEVVFQDGSRRAAPISVCAAGNWKGAQLVVVVP
jgi:hypothetical protein